MLIEEIINLAVDDKQSLAVLLRRCLVLSYNIKNNRLKNWANKELNGYFEDGDTVPPYRILHVDSKGHFEGPFNRTIADSPIPLGLLDEKDREGASKHVMVFPIVSYEDLCKSNETRLKSFWPPDMVMYYQRRLSNNGFVLTQAWHEIPKNAVVGVLDTVRNRILSTALEIKSEIGERVEDLNNITPEDSKKVDQTIVNNIFGGTAYFASGQSNMTVHQQSIAVGDLRQLQEVLSRLGLSQPELEELSTAMEQDGGKMGRKVMDWIKNTAPKVLSAGVKVATDVGQAILTDLIKRHYGLSP